jgi:hypothetical protein
MTDCCHSGQGRVLRLPRQILSFYVRVDGWIDLVASIEGAVATNGTPWTVSCTGGPNGSIVGYNVYQMQTGGKWIKMQSSAGVGIAVSPAGNAWTIAFPSHNRRERALCNSTFSKY